MTKVCMIYYSSYQGATEVLARAAARGAEQVPDTQAQLVRVEDIDAHWNDVQQADALIFGAPTYVGSVPARFKQFMEAGAGEIWAERYWLNKIAGGFTVSAGRSGDKFNCLLDILVFAQQMGCIWVPVRITGGHYSTQGSEADLNRMAGYLGVMAQANIDQPAEEAMHPSDIATLEMHGHHIASVARQYALGRRELRSDYDRHLGTNLSGRPRGLVEMLRG
jgi:NAD(P)H dehydrogenase (quinone)